MRLLVSVRSAKEAECAVAGGAEIIDAKEPLRGSLGAVEAATLTGISEAVPDGVALSVALGDLSTPAAAASAMDLIRAVPRRPAELYVKVGLMGVVGPAEARAVLEAAVVAARVAPHAARVIAVAYGDHELAGAVAPQTVVAAAAGAGARGVLLDTWSKDGRSLLAWVGRSDIRRWLEGARRRGLLTALAGSLSLDHMELIRRLGPDVFGVRGAACDGGRTGVVSARLVRQLAAAKSEAGPRLEPAV